MHSFELYSLMHNIFPFMFFIVFGLIIFRMIGSFKQSMYNNKQPIIPVKAKIATKRYDVSHHRHHTSNNINYSSSTLYYVTFELSNGERMEFKVPSSEFGMLVEGDEVTLQFQGTRFISFSR